MMQEPTRLVDDDGVPERVRRRLRQASVAPWVQVDEARGLARLCDALDADAAAAAAAAAGKSASKLWALGAAGATAGTIAAFALLWPAPSPQHTAPAVAPSAVAAVTPVAPSAEAAPAEAEAAPAAPSAPAPPAEPPARKAAPAAATHADEVAHLARARALAASDPRGALRLADEGHHTFARGILYPEREALAIECLRRTGRAGEAKARATRFVRRFPRSPFSERLRQENGLLGRFAALRLG